MRKLFLTGLLLCSPPLAAEQPPPGRIELAGYLSWLRSVESGVSPFLEKMFAWYEEQKRSPLPAEVRSDPDLLLVRVDRALRETVELEQAGEIEEGNTVGFEAFGIVDVPVETALATKLFHWGRPIGRRDGETYPFDTVFAQVRNRLSERWGPENYLSTTEQTHGGIVQDLRDRYSILVRGNAADGFVIFAAWHSPAGATATLAHTSIVMLSPTPDGRTEFRQNVRQNGQSYRMFGLEYGRRNFGFNGARIRLGEKALANTMLELRRTGTIRENRPKGLPL